MDLSAIMAEVVTRLQTMPALAVHFGYPGKLVRLPAAVVYPPDHIDFDLSYGRGTDQYPDLLVVVFVRRNTNRQSIADISPYLAGSGASSIKAKLDTTAASGYASAADVQVQRADLDATATLGGGEYVGALFHLKITGSGA